ncbi:anoctamin-7-like [Babylonia areolata]|uniref:anoctamin-7-like n=1 Tax=Babylonia areolata TaxID=304850 RepID=UPI003FD0984E
MAELQHAVLDPGRSEDQDHYTEGDIPRTKSHSRKRRHKTKMSKKQMTGFEQRYAELAQAGTLIPEEKRIDFILVHKETSLKDVEDKEEEEELRLRELEKAKFIQLMQKEGFTVQVSQIGPMVFTKLFCPFKRLCREAEKVKIEMPVKDCQHLESNPESCLGRLIDRYFETDNEDDFISAPFFMNKIDKFEGHEDVNNFFRPSVRSLLTVHILINLNIDTLDDDMKPAKPRTPQDTSDSSPQEKKGLSYMIMKKNYTDYFILHEESARSATRGDSYLPCTTTTTDDDPPADPDHELGRDPRRDLDDTWTKFFKFQPLWKIRNYFGERIAFYFAWSGMLCTSLWFPMVFGLIVFFYGVADSISSDDAISNSTTLSESFQDLFGDFKQSFDNSATPYFGLFICIWGTIFLEIWKRKTSELAYEWDVEQFESNEPDRPNFSGTKSKKDPVTDEWVWYYPFKIQFLKFWISFSVLIVMIVLVLISVLSVITYRVVISIDYCPDSSAAECLFMSTILSSIFNAVSILILSKVYNVLARWLTDWENHRTQTRYDDALIFKLFAFQFANNYASCFYIAFFQGNSAVSGFLTNNKYQDSCDGSCMTKLSFQVLVLMLAKPIPKFLKDVVWAWVMKLWNKHPDCCKCLRRWPCFRSSNQVTDVSVEAGGSGPDLDPHTQHMMFLKHEYQKPDVGNLTLDEYMEKVIQYGFLMLFGISLPLAPLLALLTNLIDLRVDARRLLWWYRRPMAQIAQDIGMWFNILLFINFVGVISSGFILGFTSTWGDGYSTTGKLIIVLAFEHIVFALKYIIAYVIPDVPAPVRLAIRREKYQILKKLEEPEVETDYHQLFPADGSGKGKSRLLKSGKGVRGMSSKTADSGTYVTYLSTKGNKVPGDANPGTQPARKKRQEGVTAGSQVSASDVKPQERARASWDSVEVETTNSPDMDRLSPSYR